MSENIAIYISDPSILGPKLFSQLEGVKKIEHKEADGRMTGLRFLVAQATITFTFLPDEDIQEHLSKIESLAGPILKEKPDILNYYKDRLKYVKGVMGGWIEPGFDGEGMIAQFLLSFTAVLNGFVFISNSVVDYDGEVLFGPFKKV